MLVVDINALRAVNLLYLGDDVVLYCLYAVYGEDIRGIYGTLRQRAALRNKVAVGDLELEAKGDRILLLCGIGNVLAGNDNVAHFLFLDNAHGAVYAGNDRSALRSAALEKLFNTGKTLCDIFRRSYTARMEGTHGELCTGLAYGLSGDGADRFADSYDLAVCKVRAVALRAYAVLRLAGEHRAYLDTVSACIFHDLNDPVRVVRGHEPVLGNSHLARLGILEVLHKESAHETFLKILDLFLAVGDLEYVDTVGGAAVLLTNDNVLRNVNESSCQITRVGGTERRISQTLTCATRGDEVFQNVKTLTVVGSDRHFDGSARGVRDKSAHTRKLLDLVHRTTGSRVSHHVDGVVSVETLLQRLRHLVGSVLPDFLESLGALGTGEETALVLLVEVEYLVVGFLKDILLLFGYGSVADRNGDSRLGGVLEAQSLDVVEHLGGEGGAVVLYAVIHYIAELLLLNEEADLEVELLVGIRSVNEAEILRDNAVEDKSADGGVDDLGYLSVAQLLGDPYLNSRVERNNALIVSHESLVHVAEHLALAQLAGLLESEVVGA